MENFLKSENPVIFYMILIQTCLSLCFSVTSCQARSSRDTGKSASSLGLADFDLLRVIGRGSYAKVLLVRLKKTERIYAMKVVKKELVNDDEVEQTDVSPAIGVKVKILVLLEHQAGLCLDSVLQGINRF